MNYLLLLLGGLQLTDGVMTDALVKGNVAHEGNKLMEPLIRDGSFLLLKLAGAFACIIALKLLSRRFAQAAVWTGWTISLFYCTVIAWNVSTVA